MRADFDGHAAEHPPVRRLLASPWRHRAKCGRTGRSRLVDGAGGRLYRPPSRSPRPGRFPACGAVAQLGERCVRNAEVGGSIPLGSTTFVHRLRPSAGRFAADPASTLMSRLQPTSSRPSSRCSRGVRFPLTGIRSNFTNRCVKGGHPAIGTDSVRNLRAVVILTLLADWANRDADDHRYRDRSSVRCAATARPSSRSTTRASAACYAFAAREARDRPADRGADRAHPGAGLRRRSIATRRRALAAAGSRRREARSCTSDGSPRAGRRESRRSRPSRTARRLSGFSDASRRYVVASASAYSFQREPSCAADPGELHLRARARERVEFLHQLEVGDRAGLATPAARRPARRPLVHRLHAELAVGVERRPSVRGQQSGRPRSARAAPCGCWWSRDRDRAPRARCGRPRPTRRPSRPVPDCPRRIRR